MNLCTNLFLKIHCQYKRIKEKRCPRNTWNYSCFVRGVHDVALYKSTGVSFSDFELSSGQFVSRRKQNIQKYKFWKYMTVQCEQLKKSIAIAQICDS